ncbi:hypothetical protein [Nocardioides donggukensis]|uniref:PASTA domain-containing protein n=1 Tax=Nocardioides donggukensis TaxID=2774019 RepID=A0A927KBK1_9ACTN|nr:hypothetical protein [Nocardioides donggukensis]MBD8871165.1 hypothetical protein [Nocardioides donggukensis]
MPLSARLLSLVAVGASVVLASCAGEQPSGSFGTDRAATRGAAASAPGDAWPASPPEGHRWVGDRGVVVAVPDWWTTGDTQCLLPVEDTVYVETGAMTDCAAPVPPETHREVSSVAVVPTDLAHGERLVGDLVPDGDVSGQAVLTGEECGWIAERACRTVVAVPSLGVAFAMYVADAGDVDPAVFRDSLTLLPDGWTTVPLALRGGHTPVWGTEPPTTRDYARLLEERGFAVRVEPAEPPDSRTSSLVASLPEGALLDIQPTPGSPIEDGAEVVLTVMPPLPE